MSNGLQSRAAGWYLKVLGNLRFLFRTSGVLEYLTPPSVPAVGGEVPCASQLPFTKEYVSPEQVITAAGALTLAHGLGVTPKFWQRYLVCKVAEFGYSVGDVVDITHTQDVSAHYGLSIVPDATNLVCRYGSASIPFFVVRKDTGAVATLLANANWRLIVRAWA